MGIAAVACAASMFAVDISSTVKMDTTIVGNNGDAVEFLKVNKKDQKDSDALIFSASTDKAGGQFQLWYNFDGTDGQNDYKDWTKAEKGTSAGAWEDNNLEVGPHGLRIRSVNVWFKPIDMIKVTVGNINMESYKERIFWWHGVRGGKDWTGFGGDYIAGVGAKAEITPIEGLAIEVGVLPGIDTAFISTAKNYGYKGYGVKAKYSLEALSVTGIFVDNGKDANKFAGIGADFGNWGTPYYGFANVGLFLNKDGLVGFALDDYISYRIDAFTIQAHIPFVMFKELDSWVPQAGKWRPAMFVSVKALYAMDGFTPYLLITNEPDGAANQWKLDDFKFVMTFQPGVTFNVGTAAFDIAARIDVEEGKDVSWKVPCGITVGL